MGLTDQRLTFLELALFVCSCILQTYFLSTQERHHTQWHRDQVGLPRPASIQTSKFVHKLDSVCTIKSWIVYGKLSQIMSCLDVCQWVVLQESRNALKGPPHPSVVPFSIQTSHLDQAPDITFCPRIFLSVSIKLSFQIIFLFTVTVFIHNLKY